MNIELIRWATSANILRAICVFVLGGILVAGLWPFHSPANQVSWLKNENGLRFGEHGTVLSAQKFSVARAQFKNAGALEIWIEPDHAYDSNTFLSFYLPQGPRQFSLQQSEGDLVLLSSKPDQQTKTHTEKFRVPGAIREARSVFITVTSDGRQTLVYINGTLAGRSSNFVLSCDDFNGKLVVGTSPIKNASWLGRLRGLAIYGQELTPTEVSEHYQDWTQHGRPELGGKDRCLALYLFQERSGDRIHNQASSDVDLYVPEQYVVPYEKVLEAPWKEYEPGWGYWDNVLINVGGFIPFGFFFVAYFASVRRIRRPALVTIVLGGILSLTIETLQAFLPTRDSGLTDVITNTFGTSMGVAFYALTPARDLLKWVLAIFARADHNYSDNALPTEGTRENVEVAVEP